MTELDRLIADLRQAIVDESPIRLHSRAIPVLRDFDGIADSKNADEGGTGLPFSAAFHRYLSHPDSWGLSRLGMSSILETSDWCAPRHPTHRRPMFTRSLCSQLAFEVGYMGQSVEDVAWLHDLPIEVVSGLLTVALRHAADWRADQFMRLTREPGVEGPVPERRRSAA